MLSSINQMREAVANAYRGLGWKQKVQKMDDDQIIAIYHKFEEGGKFDSRGNGSRKNHRSHSVIKALRTREAELKALSENENIVDDDQLTIEGVL